MKSTIFNTCLAAGWLMVTLGLCLGVSVPAGLCGGGALMVGVTLTLARWAGVQPQQQRKDGNVSQ